MTVVEGSLATFNVKLQRMIGSVFQWKRNGTNIPNATNAAYTLGPLTLLRSGVSLSLPSVTVAPRRPVAEST